MRLIKLCGSRTFIICPKDRIRIRISVSSSGEYQSLTVYRFSSNLRVSLRQSENASITRSKELRLSVSSNVNSNFLEASRKVGKSYFPRISQSFIRPRFIIELKCLPLVIRRNLSSLLEYSSFKGIYVSIMPLPFSPAPFSLLSL